MNELQKEEKEEKEDINKISPEIEISKITSEIMGEAPDCDINIEAISFAENKTNNLVDKQKRPFDITLHKVDENGLPILNKDGTLRVKKVYKKKGEVMSEPEKENIGNFDVAQAGKMFAQYTTAFCTGVFGKEFVPVENEQINENEMLADAYTAYLKTKEIENVPPTLILIGSLSLYILPRLAKAEVQERFTSKIVRLYKKIFKK